jgi:two-component system, cell cycle sensor histidine kinase and response regulator CckA
MKTPLRVLLVEDREDDALLVLGALRRGGFEPDFERVETAAAMRAALANRSFELVLSDFSLPGFSAPAALEVLRGCGLDLPFIIVSGTIDDEGAVDAMRAGAHDYLAKGKLARLCPAISRELREAKNRAERRRSEAALREREERFRLASQATNDVIRDWDLVQGEIWLSEAIRRSYGYDAERVPAAWWMERVHPEDRRRVGAELERVIAGDGVVWAGEYRLRREDGSYADVFDRCYVLREEGRPRRVLGSTLDLSEQRRAESARREAEASFRAIIERAPDLIAVYRGGRIVYANPALVSGLGFDSVAEVLGQPAGRLLPKAAGADAGALGERRWPRRDGAAVDVEAFELDIAFEGEPARVIIARDITERKQLAARSMQLDRMAAVGTLAAGVGHEINNPLAYVLANLTFLSRTLTNLPRALPAAVPALAEAEEILREAQDGASRIREIVSDLRTFARADAESVARLDVRQVLDASLRMAAFEVKHRAQVVREYGEVPAVLANESRLGQVFLNLLINAAHAIPEGGAAENQLRLSTRVEGGRVLVEVRDTGAGIAPEHLERIFEPFFTTKPIGAGTGLGLAICRQIVNALGGEIRVESALGRGTAFTVLLPPAPDERPPAAPALEAAPTGRRVRVLYVDDEPLVRNALSRLLSDEYDITTVGSAREARDRISRGERAEIILCDLMMPDMTGMELHAELTRLAPEQARRMIFLTGGAFTPRAREFLERHPRLEKPLDPRLLRELIDRILAAYPRG